MDCPNCGSCRQTMHHDLTRARLICRDCGHTGRWMEEPEWRALLQVVLDAMRGFPAALRKLADEAEREAA